MQPSASVAANPTSLTFNRNPLFGLVLVLLALLGGLAAENKRLRVQVANLEAALQLARAKRFGRSSERSPSVPPEESAGALILEGEAQALPPSPAANSASRPRGGQPGHPGHGRRPPTCPGKK